MDIPHIAVPLAMNAAQAICIIFANTIKWGLFFFWAAVIAWTLPFVVPGLTLSTVIW